MLLGEKDVRCRENIEYVMQGQKTSIDRLIGTETQAREQYKKIKNNSIKHKSRKQTFVKFY